MPAGLLLPLTTVSMGGSRLLSTQQKIAVVFTRDTAAEQNRRTAAADAETAAATAAPLET